MPDYHFYTDSKSSSPFSSYFFNTAEYLEQFLELNIHSFYLHSKNSNFIVAKIHFVIENKTALNPARAPYGGFETCLNEFSFLLIFWQEIETILKSLNVSKVEIRNWPDAFETENIEFRKDLHEHLGFHLSFNDFSFHQFISQKSGIELFQKSERKRFKKCVNAGFKFEKWQQPDLNLAYDLLFNFRQQKNIPLNISREGLIKCFELFPNRYHLFTVKDKWEIIGLSVCIEVNSEIFYHFCLSTDPNYFLFSPSVMLYEGIYDYCKTHSYRIFDFGTASIEGKKQEGLYHFKEKLGGIMTPKPSYTKSLLQATNKHDSKNS
jgi:hypothetical protein